MKQTLFYKALLATTTVEEVASLLSIPFLITFYFSNNLHTNAKATKPLKSVYIFT